MWHILFPLQYSQVIFVMYFYIGCIYFVYFVMYFFIWGSQGCFDSYGEKIHLENLFFFEENPIETSWGHLLHCVDQNHKGLLENYNLDWDQTFTENKL